MGFAALLDKQVQNALKTLGTESGELAGKQTYVVVDTGSSSYDTTTGTYTEAETEYPGIPMVLPKFSEGEIDGSNIERTDMKAIIAALDLVDSSNNRIIPKIQDKIYLENGTNYVIKRLMSVPANSVYILQIGLTQ